jgi:hypothetical protein
MGLSFEPLHNFLIEARLNGGYWYGFLNETVTDRTSSGGNPFLSTGLRISYLLVPWFSVGVEGFYRNFFGNLQEVGVGLTFTYHVQTKSATGLPSRPTPLTTLELTDLRWENVFPVFYKYYDDHPVGSIVVRNKGGAPLENVRVSFYVKQYMDNPKLCAHMQKLDPGTSVEVKLLSLFTDKVLEISEGTKVSANITVECVESGADHLNEAVETIRILDRSAMSWDDDRRAASFVTANDDSVQMLAKSAVGAVRARGLKTLDKNFMTAMSLHEALAAMGMAYAIDPTSSYKDLSASKSAVDHLQFPSQTLAFKAGDCDDLSILNCALLEAVGIGTAFITVPGHIYMAFLSTFDAAEATQRFSNPADLIVTGEKVWIPVEITSLTDGFLAAWRKGAAEWREYNPKGQAKLLPVADAWGIYEPVGYAGPQAKIALPSEERVAAVFASQLGEYIDRELRAREAAVKAELTRSGGDPRVENKLGVLYAQYGKNENAATTFQNILRRKEYWPALVNMGNLSLLQNNNSRALSYFQRASQLNPDGSSVLVGLARASSAVGDVSSCDAAYGRLQKLYPSIAKKYASLQSKPGDGSRASILEDIRVFWGEE